jgi:hypothetical protein
MTYDICIRWALAKRLDHVLHLRNSYSALVVHRIVKLVASCGFGTS